MRVTIVRIAAQPGTPAILLFVRYSVNIDKSGGSASTSSRLRAISAELSLVSESRQFVVHPMALIDGGLRSGRVGKSTGIVQFLWAEIANYFRRHTFCLSYASG
jgi:hypothetical protein